MIHDGDFKTFDVVNLVLMSNLPQTLIKGGKKSHSGFGITQCAGEELHGVLYTKALTIDKSHHIVLEKTNLHKYTCKLLPCICN